MSSNAADTKSRLLDATLTLLEAGDVTIRMADVAKAAGISRQALYLHFPTRADLLIAAARHVETQKGMEQRLAPSRAAVKGIDRLDAYVDAWADWQQEIHGIARALMAMLPTDDAAQAAWNDRMRAHREGCEAAVRALKKDARLAPDHTIRQATDVLWMLLSLKNWELLTQDCGWSQKRYRDQTKQMARRLLVAE
ncbi:TetR/AcrR family transcriptional regulator [Pyruvatibacter mobilis]|uniref:TetR/AcrR family transcriptional regulator n=1 Tax=Pyruvatibacter mobilis TaxID=1712261 RepID=UPI003D0B1C94